MRNINHGHFFDIAHPIINGLLTQAVKLCLMSNPTISDIATLQYQPNMSSKQIAEHWDRVWVQHMQLVDKCLHCHLVLKPPPPWLSRYCSSSLSAFFFLWNFGSLMNITLSCQLQYLLENQKYSKWSYFFLFIGHEKSKHIGSIPRHSSFQKWQHNCVKL